MAVCLPLFSFANPNERLMKFKTSCLLLIAGLLTFTPKLRAQEQHPKEVDLDTQSLERINTPKGSASSYHEALFVTPLPGYDIQVRSCNQLTVKPHEEFFMFRRLSSLVIFA